LQSQPREFATLVRTLRTASGLTQAELAERAGISERTVSDLERGLRATVYPATARQLAAALRVGDEDLAVFLSTAQLGRPVPVLTDQRARLPTPITRLVGRETDVATVIGLLRDPRERLITLLGPGGIGKTRLAVEAAVLTENDFSGGSFFVDLAVTDSVSMVLPLIATAVGVRPDPSPLTVSLSERLSGDATLVVLDTCEHLVAGAAAVADLLAGCPALTILATSRAALHLRGEREVTVQPLDVRAPALAAGDASPAAELFLERAGAVGASIERNDETVLLVTDICARVDGLPLAIELAAARVKHMPLHELHQRLEHRLDPLVGGARDLPARQQTMRAAVDWSYRLLDLDQQRLFRALAVFRGSFGRGAAESAAEQVGIENSAEFLTTLDSLVDSSLVMLKPGAAGRTRYRLLDVIHEYGVELATELSEMEPLHRSHAMHFLEVAERAEPELRGAEQRMWFAALSEDEANFRAALTWSLRAGEDEIALRFAGALWMFWRWAGLFDEGRGWLEAALAAGEQCSLDVRCKALWGAGWLAYHHGDYGRTEELGTQILRLIGDSDRRIERRNALTLLGNAALGDDRSGEAIAVLSDALTLCEPLGTTWYTATSMLNLGTALLDGGRAADAEPMFTQAFAVYEALGDEHFAARALRARAYALLAMGQQATATSLVKRAMSMSAGLGDAWGIAEGLEATAAVRSDNAPRSAVTLAAAANQLLERVSMRPHPPDARINRRRLDQARGQLSADAFEESWEEGCSMTPEEAIEVALA
jgi:predicted ATPase/DNA-binding XRE family transcriptional regulator